MYGLELCSAEAFQKVTTLLPINVDVVQKNTKSASHRNAENAIVVHK